MARDMLGPLMEIVTDRLRLVPYAAEHLLALIEGTGTFEKSFRLPVADGLRGYNGSAPAFRHRTAARFRRDSFPPAARAAS